MNCPNCSSETWDNTEKVKGGWRGPLRKCKDQACGWVQWPPKEKGAKQTSAPAKAGPKWTWAQLQDTYRNALRISAALVPTLVKNATSTDVVSGAATIFIAASRDGVVPPPEPLDKKPVAVEAAQQESDEDLPW